MNPSDITSMYRYDGPSYPSTVYIPTGPFQKFKAALQDPLFLGLGGAAILLGTSALVVVNQRRISNAYKSFTRKFTKYYRRMMHGAPVLTTDHIKPIVFPESTVRVEEVQDSDAETEAIELIDTVEETPAVEEEEKPAVEEETKVCTNDEKAVCKNDCSSCPNSGDIEDIKRTTCKVSGECDCSFPMKNVQLKSIPVDLTDGANKYICRCGMSERFPYCDGAHNKLNTEQGTNIKPLMVNQETTGKDVVYICACGHAAGRPDRPFCDGTHKRVHDLEPEVVAEPEVTAEAVEEAEVVEVVAEVVAEVAAEEAVVEAVVAEEAAEEAVVAEEGSTVHVEAVDAEESVIETLEEAETAIEAAETVFEEAEEAVAEAIEETEEVIAEAIEEVAEIAAIEETVEAAVEETEVVEEVVEETVEAAIAEAEEVAQEVVEEVAEAAVEETEEVAEVPVVEAVEADTEVAVEENVEIDA